MKHVEFEYWFYSGINGMKWIRIPAGIGIGTGLWPGGRDREGSGLGDSLLRANNIFSLVGKTGWVMGEPWTFDAAAELFPYFLSWWKIIAGKWKDILYMTKHDLRFVLTLFEHCDIFVCPFLKVCQKVWLSSKSMPVYFTLKKCSTQYVAHFMWVTNSLKIREYATICSTLYVLPYLA